MLHLTLFVLQHDCFTNLLLIEPCAPKNITLYEQLHSKDLLISWEEIDDSCKHGVITNYEIFIHTLLEDGSISNERIDSYADISDRTYTISGLAYGYWYNISVAGKTVAGVGERTRSIKTSLAKIVHGEWGNWTVWTPCDSSCGKAKKERVRYCDNPVPQHGNNCSGNNTQIKECIVPTCPGYMISDEMNCNTFCAKHQFICSNETITKDGMKVFTDLGIDCKFDESHMYYKQDYHPAYDIETNVCMGFHTVPNNTYKCKANENKATLRRLCNCIDASSLNYYAWSIWSLCDPDACGFEILKRRERTCMYEGEELCTKTKVWKDATSCKLDPCPVDGVWSAWTEFTHCNKECGNGNETRYRFCNNPVPKHGGRGCDGPNIDDKEECNTQPCEIDGGWSEWEEWGVCKHPCGNATCERRRQCNNPPLHYGKDCVGNETEVKRCYINDCDSVPVTFDMTIQNCPKVTWHYKLRDLSSPESINVSQTIFDEHKKSSSKTSQISNCVMKELSKGSIKATYDVFYDYIDAEQLVQLVDQWHLTGFINELPILSSKITIHEIPCNAPYNIKVAVVNQSSVVITWDADPCYDGVDLLHVYIMFTEESNTDLNTRWSISGARGGKDSLVIKYLIPGVTYKAYLLQSTVKGNGVPSEKFYINTPTKPPSKFPKDISCLALTATSIYVSWTEMPKQYQNGGFLGYKLKYKKYFDPKFQIKEIADGFSTTTMENLKAFTLYWLDIVGYNYAGEGPPFYCIVKTLEGVPSVPVPNVVITDKQDIDWWSISWGALPRDKINGILLGYRLIYYKSYQSDLPVGGEMKRIVHEFDKFTFYYKVKNLQNYETYNVTVTGYTTAGNGPSPEYYARTCKCKRYLYGNWYVQDPYTIYHKKTNQLEGLFASSIKEMIIQACSSCKKYSESTMFFDVSKTGAYPNRRNVYELKISIQDTVDVSFPYYARIATEAVVPDSVFLPMIKSSGCAFIVRDEVNVNEIVMKLVMNVLKVWPLLLVSYSIAMMFGILIWFTDQFSNTDEFNIGSSFNGPCIGFWFAFVTMTTVGYGDVTPRSTCARVFTLVWVMIGLVLNGIVIGFITTAVTSIDTPTDISLYNTKTAALNKSFEYGYAVRRNAKFSDHQYTTIDEMLIDLEKKKVDAVLVDIYQMKGYNEILASRYLKLKSIIDTKTGYGLILSGLSVRLKPDIESMIFDKAKVMSEYIESIKDEIPVLLEEARGDAMKIIFGADSVIFHQTVLYLGLAIAGCMLLGIVYTTAIVAHKRMKINPQETFLDELQYLGKNIGLENFCNKTEELVDKHTKELVYLSSMHRSVDRYKMEIGYEATEHKIQYLWDRKKRSKFMQSSTT